MRSMDDPRWLRLITIGLVLAALAVGYFLVSGRFAANKSTRQAQAPKQVQQMSPSPSPIVSPTPQPSPQALGVTQGGQREGVQTLPRTGFPLALIGIFSASAMIAGWGLCKFPK